MRIKNKPVIEIYIDTVEVTHRKYEKSGAGGLWPLGPSLQVPSLSSGSQNDL